MWTVAVVAERFHVLPTQAIEDLLNDPDQTAVLCLSLLNYAEQRSMFNATKDKTTLNESDTMSLVSETVFRLRHERLHPTYQSDGDPKSWAYCQGCENRRDAELRGEVYE
jgi:hypothetical protein